MSNRNEKKTNRHQPRHAVQEMDASVPEYEIVDEVSDKEQRISARRGRKKRSVMARVLTRLLFVLVIGVAALWVWQNWDSFDPRKMMENMQIFFAGGQKGDGFPVEIDGNSVLFMNGVDNHLALLTDTAFVMLNGKGGEQVRRPNSYSQSMMRTAGDYILIAELGGKRFRLEKRTETVLNVTADNVSDDEKKAPVLDEPIQNAIVSCAVRADGTVVLATESSQSHTSEVVVYSSKGKKLFHKYNSSLLVVDVALSPDGKSVAFAGLEAVNGQMRSTVQVFDLKNAALIKQYTMNDVMLCTVSYYANGNVVAIGDTGCLVADLQKDEPVCQYYQTSELIGYQISSYTAAVVLRDYGASDGGQVLLIDQSGSKKGTAKFDGSFRHCTFNKNNLMLLTSSHLYTVSNEGALSNTQDIPQDGRMVGVLNNQIVVLGLQALSVYTP